MTTNPKGLEPPLPTGTPTLAVPPLTRPSSQTLQQPPRSWPGRTTTPIYNALDRVLPRGFQEPPSKKQKLGNIEGNPSKSRDHAGSLDRSTLGIGASSQASRFAEQQKQARVPERLLFPPRPRGYPPISCRQVRPLAIERAARRDVVPVKAYVPEPPSCAPRYHENGPADFFPWIGHHPEDLLNELTTKSGYFDRSLPSQNESNTARPSVWSSLKHKSGLQILSSLFVSALDQRQTHGTITANSSFKPPPRVTLTDTKREAWLRDLANPIIPLRRLSRTIPHGVRGRILLDHCLSKDIPTSRAVWLAKCVGANEIRAFKRKGTGGVFTVGGEAKWIKDWTTSIEQFLESIVAMCGCPDWKTKINYGLRLASHLYSEHLLDRDHYLDWVLRSIENSDLESIPIWLLAQQIHQQEILQHRQLGRRLAGAVLEQLHKASLPANSDFYGPVLQQLTLLVKSIMMAAPACYLLLDNWHNHKATIERYVAGQEDREQRVCIDTLSKRNANIGHHPLRQSRHTSRSIGQEIIRLLDSLFLDHNFSKVAGACLRLATDNQVLVRTCIEWSASLYRHGQFRTYAAARLLRIWNKHGVDLQDPVLRLLASNPDAKGLRRKDLYRLLAHLILSKHLSVGRYLQWLMARGALRRDVELGTGCPSDVGLLFELPLHGLPHHVFNLRQTLISSLLGDSLDRECRLILAIKADIAKQLPDLFQPDLSLHGPSEHVDLSQYISQTVRSDITRWIRQTLISRARSHNNCDGRHEDNGQMRTSVSKPGGLITLVEFQAVRGILEDFEDFAILADVLNLLSDHVEGNTLTAIADTVNQCFDIFDAVGAAGDLFHKLFRVVDLDHNQSFEKAFLESLIDLGYRLSGTNQATQRLRENLSAHAPRPCAAACSPISDTMVEALQLREPTFADEMDQMLASGTSMDKQNLTRVFGTITSNLEKVFAHSDQQVIRLSRLLTRLRSFGPKCFDLLLDDWLETWLQADPSKNNPISLAPMICSKVSSLGAILTLAIRLVDRSRGDICGNAELALGTLSLITDAFSEKTALAEYRRYRLQDQAQSFLQTSPMSALAIIHDVVIACDSKDTVTQRRAECQIQSDAVKAMVKVIILQQPEMVSPSNPALVDGSLDSAMQKAVSRILRPGDLRDPTCPDSRARITTVLDNISDFNSYLAHLELQTILDSCTTTLEDSSAALSKLVVERAQALKAGQSELLTYLVSGLSADQKFQVREQAQREIFAWLIGDESLPVGRNGATSVLTAVAEAASPGIPIAETSAVMEKMAGVLTNLLPSPSLDSSETILETQSNPRLQRIEILLRLLVIHNAGIQHPKASQPVLFQLLISLSLLLTQPSFPPSSTLSNRIFDVLILLSDSLCDDTRSRCIRSLRDHHRTQDPRLRFIFGYSDSVESEWLQLVAKAPLANESRPERAAAAVPHSKPYPLRRWEMMQDATPVATESDTSLSLSLFSSRKSVL